MRWRRRGLTRPSQAEMADLLRQSRSVTSRELPAERITAIAQAMRDSLATPRPQSQTKRPRRRWIVVSLASAITAGSGAAAWAVVRHRPADNPLTIICHNDLRLDGTVRAIVPDGTPVTELCARLWADGDFGDGTVPPLVGCARPGGAAEVFPADDPGVCETLGMIPLLDESDDEQRAAQRFQDSLSDRLVDLGCIDVDALQGIVADELEGNGLENWTVTVSGEQTDEQPCAIPTIDPLDNSVVIEFLPDIWTASTNQGDP